MEDKRQDPLIDWAMELQALAQAGLFYTQDAFDRERFTRIRQIAGEMMAQKAGVSLSVVEGLFCNERGFQTPKLDTRAAVFQQGRILLVKEQQGEEWSLPGGWVDVNQSVAGNAAKETLEEAGLVVQPQRIIALHDRNRHNVPRFAYGVTIVFVLCSLVGGSFQPNHETCASGFFPRDGLPPLSLARNTPQQVDMCFQAHQDPHWQTVFE